jgi:hypothetical protein
MQFRELLDKFVEARSRDLFPFLPAVEAKATDSGAQSGATEHAA